MAEEKGEAHVPGIEDLQRGAKSLQHTETGEHKEGSGPSDDELAPIIALYEKHSGDIKAIFSALGEHPGKALKHPPSGAADFARRYLQGGYTYVEEAAERK